ncbi:MAG: ABC transporter substrate-binding protein [Deltaproteobacteria bacterium]|jgi:ABC-type nitrate/sulfonate/bicarbonate transport system substrate-binding protein|nr:ABC transporter substrate-binding protein [Deltaproteobacteria bacterium]
MAVTKKSKITIAFAALVVVLIVVGAFLGRTKDTSPSENLSANAGQKAAPSASQPSAPNSEPELKVIKTFSRKDCSLAPWLITDKLGYFKEEGIKLVFTGELQPPQRVPSIINGDNDVTSLHPNALAVAINGGAPFKGVVRADIEPADDIDPTFRHMWWFVNPEKYPNVKSFADLKDIPGTLKFSIINTSSCSDFLANRILDHYGVPRDKVEWVMMPDVQAIQALKQGLTDVGGVHPPFYKGMLEANNLKIADSLEAGLDPQVAGLNFYVFTEEFIKNNHETVKGFARAIARGQKYINENPEQARLWTQEVIGVPVSANHYYATDLQIIDNQIIPWLEDLEEHDVIPKGKLKPSDLVVHDFEQYEVNPSALNKNSNLNSQSAQGTISPSAHSGETTQTEAQIETITNTSSNQTNSSVIGEQTLARK